jgi:hypothetical protein
MLEDDADAVTSDDRDAVPYRVQLDIPRKCFPGRQTSQRTVSDV